MSSNIVLSTVSSSSSKFGYIKMSKPTKAHKAWLEAKGYCVEVEEINGDAYLKIGVEGFVDSLDISVDSLKEVTAKKFALTYKTKGSIDGVTKNGLQLCWALGPVSALVMKTEEEVRGVKAAKSAHRFDF
jgi:hypothetical protein